MPEAALGLRGLSSYYRCESARQGEEKSPLSEARPGVLALCLRALLCLEAAELGLGVVHEAHGIRDRVMASLLGNEPVHLLSNSPVSGMTLGTGP